VILLDTHALLWLMLDDAKLGREARQHIDLAWRDHAIAVSSATFWEMSMLCARGRIELPMEPEEWRLELLRLGILDIPIDSEIAVASQSLSNFHRDPADRFIVATCLKGRTLVTSDRKILQWPGKLDRINAMK